MMHRQGEQICNCTLIQKCGSGAYGEVWLAEDMIGTRVAIKILVNGSRFTERELAGLRNYKDCNHPNLLKIRHIEIVGGELCYTMDAADDLNQGQGEYLPDTLANRLQKFKRLDGREVSDMLENLLAGLEELHGRKLVHRDLKPDNILWVNGRATLADVGLVSFDGRGSFVGTPGFLSPKIMKGNGAADASDDFYALGKVLYCALTGMPVWDYPSIPMDKTISVDADLNRVLCTCCERPVHSSAEVRKILSDCRQGGEAEKTPAGPPSRKTPVYRHRRLFFLLCVLAVLAYLWQDGKPDQGNAAAGLSENAGYQAEENPTGRSVQPEASEKAVHAAGTETSPAVPQAPRANAPVPEKTAAPVRQKLEDRNSADHGKKAALQTSEEADSGTDQAFSADFWRKVIPYDQPEKALRFYLNYRPIPVNAMVEMIVYGTRNPRLEPIAGVPAHRYKKQTEFELWIANGLSRNNADIDRVQLGKRQRYWRNSPLSPEEKIAGLEAEAIFQAVRMDFYVRRAINEYLVRYSAMSGLNAEQFKELEILKQAVEARSSLAAADNP